MKGKFIVFEGIEGAGKSTNLKYLESLLRDKNIPLCVTREPGGTPLAETIRETLLRSDSEPMRDLTELLLVFAARHQHVKMKILPALERGEWVLCDRFVDATYAYQGGGRSLDQNTIELLENMTLSGLKPDLVIVLDVSEDVGMERIKTRKATPDRFEEENKAFFKRVRQTYLERAQQSDRYVVIDTLKPLTEVQEAIRQAVEQRLWPC